MEKMAHLLSFKTSGKIRISKGFLLFLLIFLLGFFLRIYRIRDYITFLGDEGRDVLVVYNILHGDLTLLGPTASVGGFFLGPIYYYFMAPFLWLFNYDPVGPAIMVVLFSMATIYLVYRLAKEFFGGKAGLISAFLYTISPVIITYSRSSWNPNPMPFFTLSSLYVLYKAVSRNNLFLFILSGILLGISIQLHYLATFVMVIVFFYVLLSDFQKNVSFLILLVKRYLLLIFGFLFSFSPFLLFEIRHGFLNTQNIIKFIFTSEDTGGGQIGPNIIFVFQRLFGGLLIHQPLPKDYGTYGKDLTQIWIDAGILLGVFSVSFLIFHFLRNKKNKQAFKRNLLILLWGFIGIGLFGFYKKPIYDYYLGFMFPLPFILVGYFLSCFIEKYKKYGFLFVSAVLLILTYINLKVTPISFFPNKQVDQVKTASEFVLSKAGDKPFNFGIIGAGNSDHAYRYFFRLAKKEPVAIEGIDVDPNRKSVTDQLFVVCEQNPCSPLGDPSQEIAGFGRAEIVGEWQVIVLKVYKLEHYVGN